MLLGAWPLGGKNVSSLAHSHGRARLLCLCASYVLYLVIGASIISAIEISTIENNTTKINNLRSRFLHKNKCIKVLRTRANKVLAEETMPAQIVSLDTFTNEYVPSTLQVEASASTSNTEDFIESSKRYEQTFPYWHFNVMKL